MKIYAADLFCGGGGTSTGLAQAAQELSKAVDLLAINHWNVAIQTHTANHPWARHLCESLDSVDPRKVTCGRLHLLVASPECTHHSIARGGKPCSDQSRASAFHILRWAEAIRVDNILIENVREFQTWGPLGANGRPIKSRKGETFRKFLEMLSSLGYRVDFRILNAADYGDATTRNRLFIMARRGNKPIIWPERTHTSNGQADLFGQTKPWRAAREIIDWSIQGQPISERKRPLSENTIKRINAGLKKFCGEPFIAVLNGTTEGHLVASARSTQDPIPSLTTANHVALCRPFIVQMEHSKQQRSHSTDKPLPTITTADAFGLVEPFLITVNHSGNDDSRVYSVDKPLGTVTVKRGHALIQPFLIKYYGTGTARSIEDPLDTVTTNDRFALVEPERKGYRLDIRFRMLQPHELAAAMSFPGNYKFVGTRDQQVKQIGNAVPVQLAKSLCKSLLSN